MIKLSNMDEWIEYKPGQEVKFIKNDLSKTIIQEIGCISGFFDFQDKIRPQRTRLIKDTLALLGDRELKNKPKYKVYANGLSKHLRQINGGTFKNSEWLYDLHWYTEGADPYTTLSLPLVMECEWNLRRKGDSKVPYSGIKYDFQKLIVSNAGLRLMIFKIKKLSNLDELGRYFQNNITNYTQLPLKSAFLFIAFCDLTKSFYYREIIK